MGVTCNELGRDSESARVLISEPHGKCKLIGLFRQRFSGFGIQEFVECVLSVWIPIFFARFF